MSLTASQIFEEKIREKITINAEKVKTIQAIYEFQLTGDDTSIWTLDLTQPGGSICQGSKGNATCTVTIALKDLADIVEKRLNPQMAFMSGKLKVTGDMGLALKLGNIL